MEVLEQPSADAFLAATLDYRTADPVQANLLGSIAQGVVEGRRYDSEQFLTVVDGDGRVVGAALRTAPFNLVLAPMPVDAARAVGAFVRPQADDLPGVSGPEPVVAAALSALGREGRVRMRDVLRVLGSLRPPPVPVGEARRAVPSDVTQVLAWQVDYLRDVGLPPHVHDEESARAWLTRLWLWEVDGQPVAMAGHAPLVETPAGPVGRIGPVHTVPDQRGRGFGAGITAVVAEHLLAAGALVMLYADAANPTSNRIYERMGFAAVGEHIEVDLL